jgi:UBX domain-containing protein 1
MFRRARASGAEVSEAGSSSGRAGASGTAFAGSAYRLGSDTTQSERVGPSADELAANRDREREFTLRMWANGFTVDEGELRPYSDPSNERFLKSIMVGKIPDELIKEARGGVVNVNMEDRKTEEYVRPKVGDSSTFLL